MARSRQISESIGLGLLLALAGGFMDAYSYIERGQVFANAQTGNILLFGINLSEGNWAIAIQYFWPVVSFTVGIAISEVIHRRDIRRLHWRQLSVLIEVVILIGVAFIPLDHNLIANSLISFVCGIQVESFRKMHGRGIATTMCIGNLRSATQNLCDYFEYQEKQYLRNSLLYFTVILSFIIGAVVGNFFIQLFAQYAILVCAFIQFIAFMMMFIDRESKII
ncbi:YoaK family protein [Listeria monocytogenes]